MESILEFETSYTNILKQTMISIQQKFIYKDITATEPKKNKSKNTRNVTKIYKCLTLYNPKTHPVFFFMFDFPCIISLCYIKNQQDETLAVLFISNCKITLHVSDAFCVHHQEY